MTEVLSSALEDLGFADFTVDNFDEILPKIVKTISEDSSNPNFLRLLSFVFGHLAAQLSLDVLDSKLLKHILPPTRSSFSNSLAKIKELLDESEDGNEEDTIIQISESLQICLDILSGYGELIEFLSQDVIQAESVGSLNRNLPFILVDAFSHCKDSENSYGSYFEESTTILTTFFKKAYEVQTKYYRLVEEKMNFSIGYEADVECLLMVMDCALKMTQIIVSLDLKTTAEQWKLYGKLYSKYGADIKNTIDIAEPLRLLVSNFEQILSALTDCQESSSEKHQLKLLKTANFLLKIIMKLCEMSQCNFRQGWKELTNLLILLNSCTRCQILPEKLCEELRRFVVVGAIPLLNVLVPECEFFKAFTDHKDSQDLSGTSKVGLLFLSLSLMKMAIDRKLPSSWNHVPFIEVVLDLYDTNGLSINMNSQFDGRDVYSSLVSISTAFIVSSADDASLPVLENCLVSKLFQGNLHTAIFVSDMFTLIGRLTSDEYCLHITTYLCEALRIWPKLSTACPKYVAIGSLVRRLWCLLLPKSREVLASKYSSSDTVCYWFDGCSPYNKRVIENHVNFFQSPSIVSYVNTITCPPTTREIQDRCGNKTSEAIVADILKLIRYLINSSSKRGDDHNELVWCHTLLMNSLKMMLANLTVSSEQLIQVFEQLKTLAVCCDESLLCIISHFLAKSTDVLLSTPTSPRLIRAVAALLIKCMDTEDRIVEISTLRVLKALDKSPAHKEIVLLVSSHNSKYLESINAHLHRTSPPDVSFPLADVMAAMPIRAHTCRPKLSTSGTSDDLPPPSKKHKTNPAGSTSADLCPLSRCIQQMSVDTKILKGLLKQSRLSLEQKKNLNCVVKELRRLCGDSDNDQDG